MNEYFSTQSTINENDHEPEDSSTTKKIVSQQYLKEKCDLLNAQLLISQNKPDEALKVLAAMKLQTEDEKQLRNL